MEKIVTKAWLLERLYRVVEKQVNGPTRPAETTIFVRPGAAFVIGRALLAIYNNQTIEEKASVSTKDKNGVGFTGPDAKLGSRCAEYFAKTGTLLPWMSKAWLVEKNGYPRICKYADQLNKIANEKKTALRERIEYAEATNPKNYEKIPV